MVAAVATALGALPLLLGFSAGSVPTGALFAAGWPAFGVVAALLLDRGGDRRVGRVCVALACVPVVVMGIAIPGSGGSVWDRVETVWLAADVVIVLLTLVVLAWAMGYVDGRLPRRRLFWLLVWSVGVLGTVVAADAALDARAEAVVVTLAAWSLAGLVARLVIASELRPVDEPLLDVAFALATLGVGATVGFLVRLAGTRAGIPAPDLAAGFATVAATALAWPLMSWWRRSRLTRRYGTGALTPEDVAAITADLHELSDPRQLLAKAAEMVAASSGHTNVGLVLGDDAVAVPDGWVEHALLVGGERVGTLLLDPDDPEGPEPRQARNVQRLLPTVGLVCRAVALAVEAERAREDVARERDGERARILGDLHDGLGPVLAGMSMRVQAELRQRPTPLLESLAPELAEARGDLRRIVSGLTPSALHGTDLGEALDRLVATFDGNGRRLTLTVDAAQPLGDEVAVAVYRSVAEGITNALRHGHATRVEARVVATDDQVDVEVQDDGEGGTIAPGVGLTSLQRRAERLGGSLVVGRHQAGGILLQVTLPTRDAP